MKTTERDARLKLLTLQGTMYRGEIVEARMTPCETSKPFAVARQLHRLLTFALKHRHMAFVGAVVPRLLGRQGRDHVVRRALPIVASFVIVVWLMRRP